MDGAPARQLGGQRVPAGLHRRDAAGRPCRGPLRPAAPVHAGPGRVRDGSVLSGAAQTLDQLVAARVLQGIGGGAIVPLATAGASLLYQGNGRGRGRSAWSARCTFLGMAIGPFAGRDGAPGLRLSPGVRGQRLQPAAREQSSSRPGAGSSTSARRSPWWRCCSSGPPPRSGRARPNADRLDALGAGLFTRQSRAGCWRSPRSARRPWRRHDAGTGTPSGPRCTR